MYLDRWQGGYEQGRDKEGNPGSEYIYETVFNKIKKKKNSSVNAAMPWNTKFIGEELMAYSSL